MMERREFLLAGVAAGALAAVEKQLQRVPLIKTVEAVPSQIDVAMMHITAPQFHLMRVAFWGLHGDGALYDTQHWDAFTYQYITPVPVMLTHGDVIRLVVTRKPVTP